MFRKSTAHRFFERALISFRAFYRPCRAYLCIFFGLMLSACSSTSSTLAPTVLIDFPQQWATPTTTGTLIADASPWWHTFRDPQLNLLIDQVLRHNNQLAIAALKVREARVRANLSDTKFTPEFTANISTNTTKPISSGNASTSSYQTNLSLSYEVDLWGKLAQISDVANWEAQATELDRQSAALTLIGTTADLYWHLALHNQRITATQQSILYAQKIVDLLEIQHQAGAISELDKIQGEQNLITQKTRLSNHIQQREETRNALAILFDQIPEKRVAEPLRLPNSNLPTIPAGIPSEILAHRPDLRAAETRLRKSLTHIDITKARFYPTFTLTGSLGTSSTTLTDILQNPIGALGTNLLLPFIQWHKRQLEVTLSTLQYEQAVTHFRQTLYTALAEVEKALSAHQQSSYAITQHQLALEYALRAEQLAEIRYRAGKTSVKEWLDQQENKRAAENTLAENQYHQLMHRMKLYQALGGEITQ